MNGWLYECVHQFMYVIYVWLNVYVWMRILCINVSMNIFMLVYEWNVKRKVFMCMSVQMYMHEWINDCMDGCVYVYDCGNNMYTNIWNHK